jgi:NAD(P)-dependent dehydrogenase (short-subunit alcohol dehydrogenase family)
MRLTDQHVVVTGAGSGIGRAMAEACAAEGAVVACVDLNLGGAVETAERIATSGGRATAHACDVTDHASVEAALAAVVAASGDVDVLLANAGGAQGDRVPFLQMDPAQWRVMVDRNLHGAFNSGQVFARHMAHRRRGSIVFTTSQSSFVAVPEFAHYTAAKAAVTQLVRSMAVELAPAGVRVNAVAPGATLTPGNQAQLTTAESEAFFARVVPLGRVADPREIAGAAVYLASEESSYTTGTTIVVDGGYISV